jgi:hypothetical protein
MERVQDAYRAIGGAPGLGKVVLDVSSDRVDS